MDPLSEPYLMDEHLAGSSDDAFYDRLSKTKISHGINFDKYQKKCTPIIELSIIVSSQN